MEWIWFFLLVAILAGAFVAWQSGRRTRQAQQLADARADAERWYERLGGQLSSLHGDELPVRQALADAGERYNAAGGQLRTAQSTRQFELARETALEGLAYVRAARTAMGLDPGPELPPLAAAAGAGALTKERAVDVRGEVFKAGPNPSADTPYYYPGGRYQGRRVPAGWYSQPWWKTALATGAGVVGGMLIFDALFSPAFADPGYDAGYQEGFGDGAGFGADQGGADAGGDYGGDYGGDAGFGGGDFGGGDFGGGGFDGGGFGGGDF